MPYCNKPTSLPIFAALLAALILLLAGTGARAATTNAAPVVHSSVRAASEAAALDQALVMIVFGADWCAPCKKLKSKTLASKEFAEQGGALHIAEVDVDAESNLARDYHVEAVPTLVLLTPDNKIVERREGFLETAELLLWLREARDRVKEGMWEGTVPGAKVNEFIAKAAADQLNTNDLARLVGMLGEPDPADREAAAKLLIAQREQAVLPLIEAVTNSYLGVRISASEALHQLAPASASVDPWQSPAELAETAAALRKWWAQTGKLPAQSPGPQTDPASAAAIAGALDNLRGTDPELRTKAMSMLVARGSAALPSVRAAIKASEKAGDQRTLTLLEDVRWAILIPDALEQRASGARNVLARGKSPERQEAATRLGRAGREAIPALAELVEDSDPLVVESAVRALSTIGGKDAIPAMAALLKAGDSNLRMTAAQALGHTKNAAAVNELLTVLDDPNEIVVCAALSAIEEINAGRGYSPAKKAQPAEVCQGLKNCLADSRWRVRAAAAEICGKLEAKGLSHDLEPLLNDPDGFVVKNALEALKTLGATPDPGKLVKVSERQPGLRGEVVELLVTWGTEDAVKAATDMYQASGTDGRLAILNGLGVSSGRDPKTTLWQPLLGQAATETDPRLRRAAADAMGAQPANVAAALVGPLLADEDAETRSKAAGVVLSVIGGERVVKASAHGTEVSEYIVSEDSDPSGVPSRQKVSQTNEPPVTAAQISAWRAALQKKAGPQPDLIIAAAIYVTGDTNAGLPGLQRAVEAADKEALARFRQSAALAAILPRLPWPAGKPVVDRLSTVPAIFLRMLTYAPRSAPGLADSLLEPARFRAAVDPASPEELAASLPRMLSSSETGFSLLAGTPRVTAVVTGLLEATNAAWRAAAVFCLGLKDEGVNPAIFEHALKDSNAWVRAAAVHGLARSAKDRATLEQRVGPLMADPDKKVVRNAAVALLEPETRQAASLESSSEYFMFEKIYAWPGGFNSSGEQRPLTVLEGKPPFLEQARQQLQDNAQEDVICHALLLAQYGDFAGLDRVVSWPTSADQERSDMAGAVAAMIELSHDPKYLPYLKKMAASTKEEYEFRRLLQALKGMPGSEARGLRLEINKRMRQATE